jgi:hypothetical protein
MSHLGVIVGETLVLDGRGRWAVVSGDEITRRVEIVVDGVPVERFDFAEAWLAGGAGVASGRGWAAAALAREASR